MTSRNMKFLKSIVLPIGLGMIAALVACSSSSSTPPPPPPKTVLIAATSGSTQSAAVGAAFANPLVATVTTGGTPTSGLTVTFAAPSSGASGTFAGGVNTATTDANGKATSPVFTANSTAGAYSVTASVSGATTSASFSLTNTAVTTTLADGNYVFSLAGSDKTNGTFFYAGAFTVASGAITTGEQHFSDDSYLVGLEAITSGTIAANTDGTLAITLTFIDPSNYINPVTTAGTPTSVTFDASMVSATKGLLTEYDSWATASGELDVQTSTLATPTGSYAFNNTGLDKFGQHFSFGGVINVDGTGTISGAGSVVDINDICATNAPCAAQVYPNQAVLNTSTVSTPDAFGYVFFFLNFDCTVGTPDPELCATLGAGTAAEIELDGYMIDNNHIRLIEFWANDSLTGTAAGIALSQTGAGGFSASSVSGSTYVVGLGGQDTNGKLQVAGLLTFNSGGTLGGNLSFNDIVAQSPQGGDSITAGTYTVDATGRVTVTGATTSATPGFAYNLQLYLTGDGRAQVISMDSIALSPDVLAGTGALQTTSSLTAASLTGTYGLDLVQFEGVNEQDSVGQVTSDAASALTGFLDVNGTFTGTGLVAKNTFGDSYATTSTNGLFNVTSTGTSATPFTAYLVDGTQGVLIENDNLGLTLGYFTNQ